MLSLTAINDFTDCLMDGLPTWDLQEKINGDAQLDGEQIECTESKR